MSGPRPIVILGPTAGGKSELAVGLAEQLAEPCQVVSADSMQVYRHMDAGTAKPDRGLRQRVPHHLIDIVEPTERFTVHDWLTLAEERIKQIRRSGNRPIIVGGTNLYIKALLEGLFDGPGRDTAFRESLSRTPADELHERLRAIDPDAADRISARDRRRLIRALEVHQLTGVRISELQTQWREQGAKCDQGSKSDDADAEFRGSSVELRTSHYPYNAVLIGLNWPTELINERINLRVRAMFYPGDGSGSESLPDEVRRLESQRRLGSQAREALGYKQVLDHLAGCCSLVEAFEQTKIQTRRFAKQQRTWLRRFRGVHWLVASGGDQEPIVRDAERVLRGVLGSGP